MEERVKYVLNIHYVGIKVKKCYVKNNGHSENGG